MQKHHYRVDLRLPDIGGVKRVTYQNFWFRCVSSWLPQKLFIQLLKQVSNPSVLVTVENLGYDLLLSLFMLVN